MHAMCGRVRKAVDVTLCSLLVCDEAANSVKGPIIIVDVVTVTKTVISG